MIDTDEQCRLKEIADKQKADFAFSNCDTDLMPNKKQVSKNSLLLSRLAIYLIIAIMLGLYVYSIVLHIKYKLNILNALVAIFPIGVSCLILILSAHNLWGKLIGFVSKNKNLQSRDYIRNKQFIEQNLLAEKLNNLRPYDTSIYVYKDHIVIKEINNYKEIKKRELTKITINKSRVNFTVKFSLADGEEVSFEEHIPNNQLSIFRSNFDYRIAVKILHENNDVNIFEPSTKQKVFLSFFTSIFIFAGIGLIVANRLKVEVPLFLGIFFILGGTIALLSVIGGNGEIMKSVIMPLLFSTIFLSFAIGFLIFIMNAAKVTNVFLIFGYVPITIVLVMFIALGLFVGLTAIIKLFKILTRNHIKKY